MPVLSWNKAFFVPLLIARFESWEARALLTPDGTTRRYGFSYQPTQQTRLAT
jgi:hypothetical protein